MNSKLVTALVVVLSAILLSGCQTVFDYGPPKLTKKDDNVPDPIASPADAATIASLYKQKYYDWASSVGSSIQIFELPIIGLGIATGANLAGLGVTKGALTQMLVSGAGVATLENYYSPRARRDIYWAGYDAMSCVEGVARGLPGGGGKQGTIVETATFLAPFSSANDASSMFLTTELNSALNNDTHDLLQAMAQINLRMVIRGTDASTQPDTGKIADEIKKAAQRSAETRSMALLLLSSQKGATFNASLATLNGIAPLLDLETDLKACVAKAG